MSGIYDDHYACTGTTCPIEEQLREASQLHRELHKLQRLNTALFGLHSETRNNETDFYYAGYDRTVGPSLRRGALDGDFFWVRRFGNSLVVLFGDAEGHYGYAGGVKMFIGFILAELARESNDVDIGPSALLRRIQDAFEQLATSHKDVTGEDFDEGGVDVVALVIDDAGTMQLAAAAASDMPLFLVPKSGFEVQRVKVVGLPAEEDRGHGAGRDEMASSKGISFGPSGSEGDPVEATVRRYKLPAAGRVVLMTDGFASLRRQLSASTGSEPLSAEVLTRMVIEASGEVEQSGAKAVVSGIIGRMAAWREGYEVDPDDDDDRLVLVIDVEKTLAHLRDSQEERQSLVAD